jgi:hypothetical protein
LVAVTAAAATMSASTAATTTAGAAQPALKIVAGSTEVTLDRYPDSSVYLDLGTRART